MSGRVGTIWLVGGACGGQRTWLCQPRPAPRQPPAPRLPRPRAVPALPSRAGGGLAHSAPGALLPLVTSSFPSRGLEGSCRPFLWRKLGTEGPSQCAFRKPALPVPGEEVTRSDQGLENHVQVGGSSISEPRTARGVLTRTLGTPLPAR